jgi:hypothetical protein
MALMFWYDLRKPVTLMVGTNYFLDFVDSVLVAIIFLQCGDALVEGSTPEKPLIAPCAQRLSMPLLRQMPEIEHYNSCAATSSPDTSTRR